jgi:carbon monoxide dehydrogenase subunit G
MQLKRSVLVPVDAERVFDYLSDFTTSTEWDPGTVTTDRLRGDGGVGTTYRNVSRFLGRTTELEYVVTECIRPRRFALRGENASVLAHDTMDVVEQGSATLVTYTATFDFKGPAALVAPLLRPALNRLGDRGQEGLAEALGRLADDT